MSVCGGRTDCKEMPMKLIFNDFAVAEKRFGSKSELEYYRGQNNGEVMENTMETEDQFISVEVYKQSKVLNISTISLSRNWETFYVCSHKALILIFYKSLYIFNGKWKKVSEFASGVDMVMHTPNDCLIVICETDIYVTDAMGVIMLEKHGDLVTDYRYSNGWLEVMTESGNYRMACTAE